MPTEIYTTYHWPRIGSLYHFIAVCCIQLWLLLNHVLNGCWRVCHFSCSHSLCVVRHYIPWQKNIHLRDFSKLTSMGSCHAVTVFTLTLHGCTVVFYEFQPVLTPDHTYDLTCTLSQWFIHVLHKLIYMCYCTELLVHTLYSCSISKPSKARSQFWDVCTLYGPSLCVADNFVTQVKRGGCLGCIPLHNISQSMSTI